MAGKRRRPIDRGEARRLLVDGVTACTHCRPDIDLGILDLLTVPEWGRVFVLVTDDQVSGILGSWPRAN